MKPRNYYAKAVTRIPQKVEQSKKKYKRKDKHTKSMLNLGREPNLIIFGDRYGNTQ